MRLINQNIDPSSHCLRSVFFLFVSATKPQRIPGHNVGRTTFMQNPFLRPARYGRDRHIGIFKKMLCGNAANSVRGFHQIVARAANVFMAEGIDKRDWFGELPGAHQKAGAVHVPSALADHYSLLDFLAREFAFAVFAPGFPAHLFVGVV
ncbi:MAG: hypothetical protein WBV36_15965 [Terriglobales bacterium]